MGGDFDLHKTCAFQNAAVASESEWAGFVRFVSRLRWQMSGGGPKRQDVARAFPYSARQQTKASRPGNDKC